MKRIFCLFTLSFLLIFTSCSSQGESTGPDLKKTGSMDVQYSDQFSVDYYEGGYSLITIGTDKYLLVPPESSVPDSTEGMTVIKQPVENIYLAATSAMDLFSGFGGLGDIALTSTDAGGWSIPRIAESIENGDITYIGKYNMPDFEALLESDCGLAIESTMIYHNPATKEKIESLGIPVLVERSSYESHPLGRMEWIKIYGLLTGKYDEAEQFFNEKTKPFDEIMKKNEKAENPKTAAFFYISSNGYINIRKPGDYISKMIEFAGGKYIFTPEALSVDDNALSTMNIQTETFYSLAGNADILIYNSTIEGKPDSIDQIVEKCSILADFKAVKEGNVWCTEQNMFQQTTGAADMISDMYRIFNDEDCKDLTYLQKLSKEK